MTGAAPQYGVFVIGLALFVFGWVIVARDLYVEWWRNRKR